MRKLERTFGAMRKVGGRAAVEYALAFAADSKQSDDRRVRALAAIEGNFDQKNPSDIQHILALAAADDTPDKVRDLAFLRVGEMPRDRVIGKLYEIFNNKKWQVRWVAAQIAIRMSKTDQIPEILGKLPQGKADNFALTEVLTYGDWMGNPKTMAEKDGKKARDVLLSFVRDPRLSARLTALGFFYSHGSKSDLGLLAPFENDATPTPKCDDKQKNCDWKCYVPKESNPKEKEEKDIKSLGEFVRFCVEQTIKEGKS